MYRLPLVIFLRCSSILSMFWQGIIFVMQHFVIGFNIFLRMNLIFLVTRYKSTTKWHGICHQPFRRSEANLPLYQHLGQLLKGWALNLESLSFASFFTLSFWNYLTDVSHHKHHANYRDNTYKYLATGLNLYKEK